MFPTPRYASLLPYDSSEDSAERLCMGNKSSEKNSCIRKSTAIHWLFHVLSIFILGFIVILEAAGPSSASCWNLYNYHSPVNEAIIDTPFVETRFRGSLWYHSPFKGPPTPEVEDAWHSVMVYGMIAVTADDILAVGHNLTAAQFPPEAGGGYIASTVGTHQLHCLHYIWQDHHIASFPTVQQQMVDVPELYEMHYEHCVDYIRQSIMCNFDTGLIPYNWVQDHNNPTPNSNAMHKCVNWERLQDWLKNRAVEMPEGFVWRQPNDAMSLNWNP